jgi:hypothetical protein
VKLRVGRYDIRVDIDSIPSRRPYAFASRFFHPSWRRHGGVMIERYLFVWACLLIFAGILMMIVSRAA